MVRILSEETLAAIAALLPQYPRPMAALLPSLHLVQAQLGGHISHDAELDVAEALAIPATRVREVVSFYTMFSDRPRGRHHVKICRNLPCQLRGADRIIARAEEVLGVRCGETTADGRVTLEHEECLASCGTAPMLWCNGAIVENLDEARLDSFLAALP